MSQTRTSHLYLVFVLALGLTACGSTRPTPPCNPEIKIVKVPAPYPLVIVVGILPPLVLEPVPAMAPTDAGPETKKENALAIAGATERNQAALVARDGAWYLKVKQHDDLAENVRRNEPE